MKIVLIAAFVLMTAGALQGMEPREKEYLRQGGGNLAAGRYQKAANFYEQAARIKPDSVEALLGMGTSYLKLGDNGYSANLQLMDKATASLRRALEIAPDLASARYQLGIASLTIDDRVEAVRQYQLLKPLDKDLAQELSKRIGAYKPPQKYRKVRSPGTQQETDPNKGSKGGVTEPGTVFNGTVDIYGADWCPHCRAAVKYMASRGISYVYHKVEGDASAKSEYQRLGGGGIPLIAIGGKKIMNGFNQKALENRLKNNR